MTVARIHFAAVKVALLQSPRCIGKRLDELGYHFLVECVRCFAVIRLADRRGSVHPMQPIYAPPPSSAMRNLRNDRNVVGVHCVREFSKVWDHTVIEQLYAVPIPRRRGRVHTCRAEAHQ